MKITVFTDKVDILTLEQALDLHNVGHLFEYDVSWHEGEIFVGDGFAVTIMNEESTMVMLDLTYCHVIDKEDKQIRFRSLPEEKVLGLEQNKKIYELDDA